MHKLLIYVVLLFTDICCNHAKTKEHIKREISLLFGNCQPLSYFHWVQPNSTLSPPAVAWAWAIPDLCSSPERCCCFMLWPQKKQLWTKKHDTIWWLRVWGSATPKPAVLSCWQSAGDLALARRLAAVGSVSNETLAWQGSKVGRNYIERYLFHEDIIPSSPKAFEQKDRTYEK